MLGLSKGAFCRHVGWTGSIKCFKGYGDLEEKILACQEEAPLW